MYCRVRLVERMRRVIQNQAKVEMALMDVNRVNGDFLPLNGKRHTL